MKLHYHKSLLERVLENKDIYMVDLSTNDFFNIRDEVIRAHCDHGKYPDFVDGGTELKTEFYIGDVIFNLEASEPDI